MTGAAETFNPLAPNARNLNFSQGLNLPFNGEDINNFDTVSLSNGTERIVLTKNSVDATTSIRQSTDGKGATGLQVFSTPTTNTQSQANVTLGANGTPTLTFASTASQSNQTLANRLENLTSTQWLMIGGAVAVGVLLFAYVRRG